MSGLTMGWTMAKVALTIAGSDSGGGAGIQADLKTFSALGIYGASVVTAITAQNTRKVTAVEAVSPAMVHAQIEAIFDDIDVHAVKIGMLPSPEVIMAVTEALQGHDLPIVLDPVMIAKSGDVLLPDSAIAALRRHLLPLATILTPNRPEASRLLGEAEAQTQAEVAEQGRKLALLGPRHVLMKGGHATGPTCIDLLIGGEVREYVAPRIPTDNTHGTGCTLSSAIAAGLAQGMSVPNAVGMAHEWLHQAILAADTLHIGHGHGPVHHFHAIWGRA